MSLPIPFTLRLLIPYLTLILLIHSSSNIIIISLSLNLSSIPLMTHIPLSIRLRSHILHLLHITVSLLIIRLSIVSLSIRHGVVSLSFLRQENSLLAELLFFRRNKGDLVVELFSSFNFSSVLEIIVDGLASRFHLVIGFSI